jgi:hypothetical protein
MLARKKRDEGLKIVNFIKVEGFLAIHNININKNHHNKALDLLVKISNHLVERLVSTCVFMSINVV